MKYLLDTNIVAYIIKKRPIEVLHKLQSLDWTEVAISSIVVAELWYGVKKSQLKEQNKTALEAFLKPFTVLDFDTKAAEAYASIRGSGKQGENYRSKRSADFGTCFKPRINTGHQ